MDGVRREASGLPPSPAPLMAVIDSALAEPPADLTPVEQEFWRQYAPAAIEQRTLIAPTVAGFRELCQLAAFKATLARKIHRLGAGSPKADAALRHYVKLSQRLDATLARYKLTGFGKPEQQARPAGASATNPWAQVAGPTK